MSDINPNDDDTQKLSDISKLVAAVTEGGWHAVEDSSLSMIAGQAAVEMPVDQLESEYVRMAERIRELEAERDALAAENAQLKAALKPFADAGDDLDEWDGDDPLYMEFTHGYYSIYIDMDKDERLTIGHLKAAARALKVDDGA
jgi:hypothetical protein